MVTGSTMTTIKTCTVIFAKQESNMPYFVFLIYLRMPTGLKMRIYWWAMRNKHFKFAWNLADHMVAIEDDRYYLLVLAEQACFSGEIR
jgi:hypothetical protein